MAQLVAFIKEWNGRHIGDGVFFDEPEAAALIERGIAMDAKEYREMIKEPEKKALEKPTKDKMVHAPKKKK